MFASKRHHEENGDTTMVESAATMSLGTTQSLSFLKKNSSQYWPCLLIKVMTSLFVFCFQDGFVKFYEGPAERRNESPWPPFKTVCGYALGAVGVLTLAAILAQKS